MNIKCFLVSDGKFEKAILPETLLGELVKSLKTKGIETVHFAERSIEVEGIYIPAKNSKTKLMAFQDKED
jgi:hypothetical protein